METKNNEENGVLRERFALAMERIGEIAGELRCRKPISLISEEPPVLS